MKPSSVLLLLLILPAGCASRVGSQPDVSTSDTGRDAGLGSDARPDATLTSDANVTGADAALDGGIAADGGPHPTPGQCTPDPTSTGNSKNVGAYCTAGGGQCAAYPAGNARLCAIDLDPSGGSFCIKIGCSDHQACGEEACCTGRPGQPVHACVPKGCLAPDADVACPPIPRAGAEDGGAGGDA